MPSGKTLVLLLGSRDGSTEHQSINIVTILQKCDRRYPGIEKLYAILSESAHPNFEGMAAGYSKVNHADHDAFLKPLDGATRRSTHWGDGTVHEHVPPRV
jgi:lipid A disaccharide synthetase